MWRATRSATYRDREMGNSELSALFAFIPRASITSKPKRSYDSGGVKVKRLDDSAERFTKHLFYRVNMDNTYFKNEHSMVAKSDNPVRNAMLERAGYTRINRDEYRKILRAQARDRHAQGEAGNEMEDA